MQSGWLWSGVSRGCPPSGAATSLESPVRRGWFDLRRASGKWAMSRPLRWDLQGSDVDGRVL